MGRLGMELATQWQHRHRVQKNGAQLNGQQTRQEAAIKVTLGAAVRAFLAVAMRTGQR